MENKDDYLEKTLELFKKSHHLKGIRDLKLEAKEFITPELKDKLKIMNIDLSVFKYNYTQVAGLLKQLSLLINENLKGNNNAIVSPRDIYLSIFLNHNNKEIYFASNHFNYNSFKNFNIVFEQEKGFKLNENQILDFYKDNELFILNMVESINSKFFKYGIKLTPFDFLIRTLINENKYWQQINNNPYKIVFDEELEYYYDEDEAEWTLEWPDDFDQTCRNLNIPFKKFKSFYEDFFALLNDLIIAYSDDAINLKLFMPTQELVIDVITFINNKELDNQWDNYVLKANQNEFDLPYLSIEEINVAFYYKHQKLLNEIVLEFNKFLNVYDFTLTNKSLMMILTLQKDKYKKKIHEEVDYSCWPENLKELCDYAGYDYEKTIKFYEDNIDLIKDINKKLDNTFDTNVMLQTILLRIIFPKKIIDKYFVDYLRK